MYFVYLVKCRREILEHEPGSADGRLTSTCDFNRKVTIMTTTTATTALSGEVVRLGDPTYDAARLGWNKLYQRHPEAIVYCSNTTDVVNAVSWARSTGLPFRARSGGHNLEGWSSIDGGLVIDVSRMKDIQFDEAAGTATVGTGLLQKEVVAALGEHGYTIPTGSEGGVGLGGVVLGGGFGLLTRRMGLACDRLLAADIVVADGTDSAKVIHVDQNHHADLLWACRGGGGNNFGITTAYTVRLEKLADVCPGRRSQPPACSSPSYRNPSKHPRTGGSTTPSTSWWSTVPAHCPRWKWHSNTARRDGPCRGR